MTRVHELIDEYARRLHRYADFAHGVFVESGADVEDDPRVEAQAWNLSLFGATLDDAMSHAAGVGAPVSTGGEPASSDDADPDEAGEVETGDFFMHFGMISVPENSDEILELLQSAGEGIVSDLASAGYEVRTWSISEGGLGLEY